MTNTHRSNRSSLLRAALMPAVLALALVAPASAQATVPTPPTDAQVYGADGTAWLYPPMAATDANPYGMPMIAIPTDDNAPDNDPMRAGWDALTTAGYAGNAGDNVQAIYAPENLVVNAPGGTWTVTANGLRHCTDFVTTGRECDGSEFLR